MERTQAYVIVVGPVPEPVTGASMVTIRMIEALRAATARTYVADTNDGPLGRRLWQLWRGLALIVRWARARPHVYIAGAGGELLWYQVVVVAVARAARARLVFHHHSFAPLIDRSRPMRAIVRIAGPEAVHVVQGARMERLLRQMGAAGEIIVCSNAGHMEPGEPAQPRPARGVVLGLLSNLTMEKGAGRAIEVLRSALEAGIDATLVLGGPADPAARSAILAAQRDLGDRLEWVGPVAPDLVDEFYGRIDLFLFPSLYHLETEGMVVLEAQRNGAPAIVHDIGDVAAAAGPTGTVVPPAGDFVAAAVERSAQQVVQPTDRDEVRASFLQRREVAAAAWSQVVDLLTT